MKKWKFSYQIEVDPRTEEREERSVIIEAGTREEADLWAARKIVGPMVQEGNPYIPFIYGSAKLEEMEKTMPTYQVTVAIPDEDDRVIYVSAVDAETATDYVAQNEVADVKDATIIAVEEV